MTSTAHIYQQCESLADFYRLRPRGDKLWKAVAHEFAKHKNYQKKSGHTISDEEAFAHTRKRFLARQPPPGAPAATDAAPAHEPTAAVHAPVSPAQNAVAAVGEGETKDEIKEDHEEGQEFPIQVLLELIGVKDDGESWQRYIGYFEKWFGCEDDQLPGAFLTIVQEFERRGLIERKTSPPRSADCKAGEFCESCCDCQRCQGHLCGQHQGCCVNGLARPLIVGQSIKEASKSNGVAPVQNVGPAPSIHCSLHKAFHDVIGEVDCPSKEELARQRLELSQRARQQRDLPEALEREGRRADEAIRRLEQLQEEWEKEKREASAATSLERKRADEANQRLKQLQKEREKEKREASTAPSKKRRLENPEQIPTLLNHLGISVRYVRKNGTDEARDDDRRWDLYLQYYEGWFSCKDDDYLPEEFLQIAQELERRGLIQRQTSVRDSKCQAQHGFCQTCCGCSSCKGHTCDDCGTCCAKGWSPVRCPVHEAFFLSLEDVWSLPLQPKLSACGRLEAQSWAR